MRDRIYRFLSLKDQQIRSHVTHISWNSISPVNLLFLHPIWWAVRCLALSSSHQPYNNLTPQLTTSSHSIWFLVVNIILWQCYISKCNNPTSLHNHLWWCKVLPHLCLNISHHLLTTHQWLTWLLWTLLLSSTILNWVYWTNQVINPSRVYIRQSLMMWTKLVVGLIRATCTGSNHRNASEQICGT